MGSSGCRRRAGVLSAAVLLAACGGGSVTGTGGDPDLTDPAAAVVVSGSADAADVVAALEGGSGARPDTGSPSAGDEGSDDAAGLGPIDPLDIAGEIINEYNLVNGDCFNRFEGLQSGRRLAITARVDCAEPHWAEVYHTFELDAAHPSVFPGDDAMSGFALRVCYEQFEAFVGEAYELSDYEIGVFTPNRTNFEHDVARYRGVHCWLYVDGDEQLAGTARGSAT